MRESKRSVFSNAQALNQIALTDDEEKQVQDIFDMMRDYEQKLAAVDAENVDIMVHVSPMQNIFREDVRSQPFAREDLLAGAPAHSDDSWQVPRVVK